MLNEDIILVFTSIFDNTFVLESKTLGVFLHKLQFTHYVVLLLADSLGLGDTFMTWPPLRPVFLSNLINDNVEKTWLYHCINKILFGLLIICVDYVLIVYCHDIMAQMLFFCCSICSMGWDHIPILSLKKKGGSSWSCKNCQKSKIMNFSKLFFLIQNPASELSGHFLSQCSHSLNCTIHSVLIAAVHWDIHTLWRHKTKICDLN